jgi:hypothetical protein
MNELYFRNCKNGLLCHASWWFSLNSLTHQYELINLASVRFDPFFIIGNLITRHYNPHSVKNNLTVTWPASGCSFLSGSSREAFSCPTQCYSKKKFPSRLNENCGPTLEHIFVVGVSLLSCGQCKLLICGMCM